MLGKPGIYEAKGEFQFNVTRMIPTAAIGAAQREFERVKEASSSVTACSTRARKRPIPAMASTVAVVTSTAGAALRDVITVVGKRWPCCRLVVVNARVQGDGAVGPWCGRSLVNRIPDIEVCIVGRGGGGREDLAAFNSEAVCRALAEVRVPTISAVGHETDLSLTDLVADLRARRRPPRRRWPSPTAVRSSVSWTTRGAARWGPDRTRLAPSGWRARRPAARLDEAVLRRERTGRTGSPPSSTP